MKSFKKVEEDRIAYHKNPSRFSVHRSSLLVPVVKNYDVVISFLNHFLIKRNNNSVALKISAYTQQGYLVDSHFEEINKKKVYEFNLSKIFSHIKKLSSFQIEFFSSKNLFIPFPAVIVQHKSSKSKNIIHSYNRILNDTSEDLKINSTRNYESSFEAIKTNNSSTGFIFHSGQDQIMGKIKIEIYEEKKRKIYYEKIDLAPFSTKFISLKKYLRIKNKYYFCRISQPKQKMFFGRLLVGSFSNDNYLFTANHSFYDSSNTNETFNNDQSYRQYPYFSNFINRIKFYPINGRSNLEIFLKIKNKELFVGNIKSPSSEHLDINISDFFEKNNITADTYTIIARSANKIPTRVNHQLIIGKPHSNYNSSINVSLLNENIYKPLNKKSYIWGYTQLDKNYETVLNILGKHPQDKIKCTFSLYSTLGLVYKKKLSIKQSKMLTINDLFCKKIKVKNDNTLWYSIESGAQNLQAFTVLSNKSTGASSGEHNF